MKNLLTIVIALLTFAASAQKVECHFTESKFIKASGKTIESEGNLKLTPPDKLEMTYWRDIHRRRQHADAKIRSRWCSFC